MEGGEGPWQWSPGSKHPIHIVLVTCPTPLVGGCVIRFDQVWQWGPHLAELLCLRRALLAGCRPADGDLLASLFDPLLLLVLTRRLGGVREGGVKGESSCLFLLGAWEM